MAVNLVNLENVSVAHGSRQLMDAVSLGVSEGDRIGIVGRNGGGKTTLLKTLIKAEEPDSGRVTHGGSLRVGVLTQDVRVDETLTAHQAILGDAAEHTWAGDARVREVLDGLGLHDVGLDSVVSTMSGGERRRVALAALLVQEWDLLVLDEPTNHLDVEGVAWLAAHLKARTPQQAHLVVTHDRWFLDEVNTRTWEVHDGVVDAYEGGYSAYVLARAERDRMASTQEQKRLQLVKKELAWLRRGPPARTSKPQFRIDAANALIADEPPARDDIALQRFATARLGKQVYDVEDVSLAFDGRVHLRRRHLAGRPGRPRRHRRRQRRRQVDAAQAARRAAAARRRHGQGRADGQGRLPVAGGRRARPDAARARGRAAGRELGRPRRQAGRGVARCATGSASPATRSGPASATCPAASGGGCRCCGCSWASRTCCCSTSRRTTSTSTRSTRSRTSSTAGPARCSSSATTGTSSSGSPT